MKTNFLKIGVLTSLFIGLLLVASCQKEEATQAEEMNTENVQKSTEIDVASDVVSSVVEEVYVIDETTLRSAKSETFLPECMTKTVVIENLTCTVTLEFDNCSFKGNLLDGTIIMVYERDPEALSRTITYSFLDFYFNNKLIEGGGTILRERFNANGNPQSTKNQDVTVTWPDGKTAHRVGVKVREWIEGFGSGTWGDNVFSITGQWTTEFPDGDVNSGIVTTPLRRELACNFIVSGVIAVSHNELAGTIDFGSGSCDNEAIFTNANGVEHTIILH
jgi:hypothetical protein